jgi:hypothetical protein
LCTPEYIAGPALTAGALPYAQTACESCANSKRNSWQHFAALASYAQKRSLDNEKRERSQSGNVFEALPCDLDRALLTLSSRRSTRLIGIVFVGRKRPKRAQNAGSRSLLSAMRLAFAVLLAWCFVAATFVDAAPCKRDRSDFASNVSPDLSLVTVRWAKVQPKTSLPSARSGHVAYSAPPSKKWDRVTGYSSISDTFHIYGGITPAAQFNVTQDVWSYNYSTRLVAKRRLIAFLRSVSILDLPSKGLVSRRARSACASLHRVYHRDLVADAFSRRAFVAIAYQDTNGHVIFGGGFSALPLSRLSRESQAAQTLVH